MDKIFGSGTYWRGMLLPCGKVGVEAPDRARLTTWTLSKEEEGVAKEAGGDEAVVQGGGKGGDNLWKNCNWKNCISLH